MDSFTAPQILNRRSWFSEYVGNIFSLPLKLRGQPLTVHITDKTTRQPVILLRARVNEAEEVNLNISLKKRHIGEHTFRLVADNNFGKVIYNFELSVCDRVEDGANCTLI